ncbi:H/ACA ribonucleoprotein complex non-core subunit NAF1 isoform X2 [Varanus komodoensis]|uniref:H/ACA ribonucleoprotein complex non-core subunit NAF1 isoform X2 n=1 Tax=Varanus komodoensis TaxID=61221 RepID=UPI001CF78937|nr:H/ACA ribonucleoprotein complex non-core subunit NAF1 isoform X2 [Varanus komodoensis]
MDQFSVSSMSDDSGLAGLKVMEQLQTLSVASEESLGSAATCAAGPVWKEGEGAALDRRSAEDPPSLPGLPEEAQPAEAVPSGGDVEERASHPPGPCLGLVEPSGFVPVESSSRDAASEGEPPPLGDTSVEGWTEPNFNPGARGEPDPEAAESLRHCQEVPREGEDQPCSGGEVEEKPPPGSDSASSAALLKLNGGPEGGGIACSSGPEVLEGEKESAMEGSSASSESETESDTDTDSSTSSSSSGLPMLSEDDQQYKNGNNSCSPRKKDGMSENPFPVEDLIILLPESVELMSFGKVSSIIEHLVIIESQKGLPPVNEDTVLFKEDRQSVGKIFEVFGPVSHPFYVVQFNSPEHIESKGIKIHDAVYFAPSVESFTQYIFPEKLKQERGSDASWKNDEEPPPEALDFSDDEKERAAKQKKSQNLRRKKFRSQQDNSNENGVNYQPRQQYPLDYSSPYRQEPHPSFSRSRFPHLPASPHFFRQEPKTHQRYSSEYTELRRPPVFCQQSQETLRRHHYSFPPPSFETISNETHFPPSPVTWGWPQGCTQNVYDPLLSLLSLPPPPPPPPSIPPPSAPPPP